MAGRRLVKAVLIAGRPRIVTVTLAPGGRAVSVTCDPAPGGDGRAAVGAIVRRLLGLGADAAGLARRATRDPVVARLVAGRRGLRVPLTATPFEALVWAILGQQINLAFAATLRRRVIAASGRRHHGGMIAHPTAADVARLPARDLAAMRISTAKVRYLLDAASAIATGELPLDRLADLPKPEAEARLMAVRGIGPWTANYVLLRGFGFGDCVPVGDSGLAAALQRFYDLDHRPAAAETERLMAVFAPYRSLATCHLWAGLDKDIA